MATVSSDLSRPTEPAEVPAQPGGYLSAEQFVQLRSEFAAEFSADEVNRTLDVARHVLERSHALVSPATVSELARQSLRRRARQARSSAARNITLR